MNIYNKTFKNQLRIRLEKNFCGEFNEEKFTILLSIWCDNYFENFREIDQELYNVINSMIDE